MNRLGRISLCVLLSSSSAACCQQALPQAMSLPGPLKFCTKMEVVRLNRRIHGQVLDFSGNHGVDRRVYCPSLDQCRDLYVYLPPGYDRARRYPVLIWLHGILQDEKSFLETVHHFDAVIASGQMPPFIIAAPDGSLRGRPTFRNAGSFYLNSNAGRYEDYIAVDVWTFVTQNFAVCPEREAHVIAGASMGGFGAYNLAIKYRDRFGAVVGIMPALNLRYTDCHGEYFTPFNPACAGYVDRYRPKETVGKFACGLIHIRQSRFVDPLFGRSPAVIEHLARENPVEMLDTYDVRPGQLAMFIGYGTRDQFNLGAQCESFAYRARERGLELTMLAIPGGKHETATGLALFPELVDWLAVRLAPFTPGKAPADPHSGAVRPAPSPLNASPVVP